MSEKKVYTHQTPYDDMMLIPKALIEELTYHGQNYDTATSRSNAGYHLTEFLNHLHTLKTWDPTYEMNTGTIEWERRDI